jgi:predicted acyltransferase
LYSLDAFRGLTMIWMFSEGFGLNIFDSRPGFLGAFARQFDHAQWIGFNAWDLIQPFFMFIVGVAMPLAFAKRAAAGDSWSRQFSHVLRRCALLIAFGLLARSIQAGRPVLDLINVLAQVSVTYLIAFLLLDRSWRTQLAAAFSILLATWAIYQFSGFPDPWAFNNNIGYHLDGLLLGKHWGGGYATLNCLPSSFNTILGAVASFLLTSAVPATRKARILALSGLAFLAAGWALHPLIPISKKIWTPSFAIISTGWCLLALLAFWYVCDVRGKQAWARILVMVGANSIFIYLFHEILNRWLHQTAPVFTGWLIQLHPNWGHLITNWALIAFQIWVCVWLYRRRIFFKV